MKLKNLPQGREAIVCAVHFDGTMRRRLLDFGLIEGTRIACLRQGRGSSVYRVRGAMLALRHADTANICVQLCD